MQPEESRRSPMVQFLVPVSRWSHTCKIRHAFYLFRFHHYLTFTKMHYRIPCDLWKSGHWPVKIIKTEFKKYVCYATNVKHKLDLKQKIMTAFRVFPSVVAPPTRYCLPAQLCFHFFPPCSFRNTYFYLNMF